MDARQNANSEGANAGGFSIWRTAHALCALLVGCLALAAGLATLFAYGCVGSTENLDPCVGGTRLFVQWAVGFVVLVACVAGNVVCLRRRPTRWGVVLLVVEVVGVVAANALGALFSA